jgi:type III secretion protein V
VKNNRGLERQDVILAGFVIAVVAMMILPLPTFVLDVLLAVNLSLSVSILLVVLYAKEAMAISAFPTLLLLTTLFRLALNVSSSRLILLQANAGEVIKAFGNFVVRGNYVVGAVIFLILTVIQFVVITKGAERVAEVGARFVLDAMPGKQMAIDAELRSGGIDSAEARKRRGKLSRESQFYGAMDGAMKFVKGDVIASLIITVVNILAGLAIGVAQKDMAAGAALKKYGLLTIGDGLVSQIPALVLSTAAGILVTRSAAEDENSSLGKELGFQLFSDPKALLVASVFVLSLAFVPGFPFAPFFVIAAFLFWFSRQRPKNDVESHLAPARAASGPSFIPVVIPWSVTLAADLAPALLQTGLLSEKLTEVRERLFDELGIPLPAPRIRLGAVGALADGHATLSLFEVPARTFVPTKGSEADELAAAATLLLKRRATDYLTMTETQRLLDELEPLAPASVRNVVPKPVSVPLLTDILRRLVEEGVSIRDLKSILEALATVAAQEKDPLLLTELVRGQLRRPLTFKLTGGSGALEATMLDPMIEDAIRRAVTRTQSGSFLSLAPGAARDVIASVRRAHAETAGKPLVILTQPDIRRFVRKLLEIDFPDVTVVSFAELLPEINVRAIARAHLAGIG